MVTTFFDNITKLSDHFTFSFVEELKKDVRKQSKLYFVQIDLIIQTLYQSANELAVFYTYLLMLLRKLQPVSGSFVNTLIFCKTLARKINEDSQSPKEEFNKFFINHLFKNYCQIVKECPNKRQYICELIFCHTVHDLNLRIKVVQNLKNYISDDEIVYSCQAYLIGQEQEFNEQWFDVFLYYALIGLANPKTYVRVYSLNILNSIAKHNPESIMDITEKVLLLCSKDQYWEIKAQCLMFATIVLNSFRNLSHLLSTKEDVKGGIKRGLSDGPTSSVNNGPGSNADKNVIKKNLNLAIDIILRCFSVHSPKSVQKLGLFELQPLLNDYKQLYPPYVEVLVQIDQEIKSIILSEEPIRGNLISLYIYHYSGRRHLLFLRKSLFQLQVKERLEQL